jgi:hypothetical protein
MGCRGAKLPVLEVDHSPSSTAEVRNAWRYTIQWHVQESSSGEARAHSTSKTIEYEEPLEPRAVGHTHDMVPLVLERGELFGVEQLLVLLFCSPCAATHNYSLNLETLSTVLLTYLLHGAGYYLKS